MTTYPHPAHVPTLRLSRLGATLAAVGATLGLAAGTLELAIGPHIRTWVGNKIDTTRLGLATIALSAIALAAALTWLRQHEPPVTTRLLIVVGLIIPAGICFTTAGRSWYLPGALLLLAAASAVAELRHQAAEARATIARTWLPALTTILAALYIFLGATALGLAGLLGILGGIAVLALLVSSARLPRRLGRLLLVAAALPFAALTWWSVVTPLLAILMVGIGWPTLRSRGHREEGVVYGG
jgi:hypothetical protein